MRRATPLLVAIALLSGCGAEKISTDDNASRIEPATTPSLDTDAEEQRNLATLRRVTEPFHHFDAAKHAGWSQMITGCMTDSVAGGMGFHFGNPNLINGTVRVDEPELLLYEPEKGGGMRLVAVEYMVPLTAWTAPRPPRLFGRDFKVNSAFGIWALHAWVWKNNPSGLYADWNPTVSCANATTMSTMAH